MTKTDPDKGLDKGTDKGMDKGWAWVVMISCFFSIFICGGLLQTAGVIQAILLDKYGQGVAKTAWVSSTFVALLSLSGPIGSFVIDRTNCRTAIMTGGILMAVGCLICAFAPNIDVCIFAYGLLSGFGGGIAYTAIFSANGFNFKKRLNLAQGITMTGVGCGLFVVAPVMEASKAEFGYTGFFLILSGICLQMVIFGALIRPSAVEIRLKQLRRSKLSQIGNTDNKTSQTIFKLYKDLLMNKFALLISFSMLTYCGGIYTVFLHWPNFCIEKGFTPMQASFVLSIVGILSICGRAVTGFFAALNIVDEILLYSGSLAILSIPLIAFQFYSSLYYGHIISAVIFGLFNGSCFVLITTINVKHIGVEYLSAAIGIQFWFGGIGSIVIPVLSGYMLNVGWTYEHVFLAAGVCILIASVLGFTTQLVKHRKNSPQFGTEQDIREIIVTEGTEGKETLVNGNDNQLKYDIREIETASTEHECLVSSCEDSQRWE